MLRQFLPDYIDTPKMGQTDMIHHACVLIWPLPLFEECVPGRNPRFSLSFQLCKVLEADLRPRFK
ncbi:MAG TPA: hypothetical protein PLY87_08845, partial [Planctomycetaceae bacterium]|nr:hypothetical protein [Planctomycetaceae bacterium]